MSNDDLVEIKTLKESRGDQIKQNISEFHFLQSKA